MSDNTDEPTSTIAFADIDITATQRFINIPWSVDMSMSDAEWYDGQTLINDYYPDPPKCKSDPPPQVQAVLPTPLVLVSAPALENACTTVNESAQHVDTPAVASSAAQTHSQTYISTDQAPPTELPRLNTIKLFTHDVIHPSEEGGIMPGQIETVTDVVQVWECPFRPCDHIYDNELKYHDHMKVEHDWNGDLSPQACLDWYYKRKAIDAAEDKRRKDAEAELVAQEKARLESTYNALLDDVAMCEQPVTDLNAERFNRPLIVFTPAPSEDSVATSSPADSAPGTTSSGSTHGTSQADSETDESALPASSSLMPPRRTDLSRHNRETHAPQPFSSSTRSRSSPSKLKDPEAARVTKKTRHQRYESAKVRRPRNIARLGARLLPEISSHLAGRATEPSSEVAAVPRHNTRSYSEPIDVRWVANAIALPITVDRATSAPESGPQDPASVLFPAIFPQASATQRRPIPSQTLLYTVTRHEGGPLLGYFDNSVNIPGHWSNAGFPASAVPPSLRYRVITSQAQHDKAMRGWLAPPPRDPLPSRMLTRPLPSAIVRPFEQVNGDILQTTTMDPRFVGLLPLYTSAEQNNDDMQPERRRTM